MRRAAQQPQAPAPRLRCSGPAWPSLPGTSPRAAGGSPFAAWCCGVLCSAALIPPSLSRPHSSVPLGGARVPALNNWAPTRVGPSHASAAAPLPARSARRRRAEPRRAPSPSLRPALQPRACGGGLSFLTCHYRRGCGGAPRSAPLLLPLLMLPSASSCSAQLWGLQSRGGAGRLPLARGRPHGASPPRARRAGPTAGPRLFKSRGSPGSAQAPIVYNKQTHSTSPRTEHESTLQCGIATFAAFAAAFRSPPPPPVSRLRLSSSPPFIGRGGRGAGPSA
ncbi:MAG: hypothetical protein J3K34DRAFT_422575 [Monoraphidium minutum]|nr:MAG: hypothetical protein J3K34DRAFT_422575 [Monoraphidium minutum]